MTPRRLVLAVVVYLAAFGAASTWLRSLTPPGGWSEAGAVALTLMAHTVFVVGLVVYDERRKRRGRGARGGEAPGTAAARRPLPLVAAGLAAFVPFPIVRFAIDDFSISGFARGVIMTLIALLGVLVGIAIVRYGYRDLV